MKVIVGLVPVGRITDSSTSGAARAVAERVSRDRCSRPLEGVFEIGTTVDARQGIGAEVLIVVSPVVDGGIDANLSAFLRSTEMLAGRLAIAVKVRRWSQDANVVDPYLKPALLAADASCLLLGLHLTEEADAGVPSSCRPWRPVLDSILASSLAEDRPLMSSRLSPDVRAAFARCPIGVVAMCADDRGAPVGMAVDNFAPGWAGRDRLARGEGNHRCPTPW
ncbi:MAG: hypothetical protein QOC79_373 [Actinomycetota bacterium]|nr:hypothetical protein [Actinomycetota bacterium]